jgi:hypothetical protein
MIKYHGLSTSSYPVDMDEDSFTILDAKDSDSPTSLPLPLTVPVLLRFLLVVLPLSGAPDFPGVVLISIEGINSSVPLPNSSPISGGTTGTSKSGSKIFARSKYFLAKSRSLLHPAMPPSAWTVDVEDRMDERAE